VAKYQTIATFKANIHQLFIQAQRDSEMQWIPLSFKVEDEEIDKEIAKWVEEWKILVDDNDIPPHIATRLPLEDLVDIQYVHSSDHEEEEKEDKEKYDEDKTTEEHNEGEKDQMDQLKDKPQQRESSKVRCTSSRRRKSQINLL